MTSRATRDGPTEDPPDTTAPARAIGAVLAVHLAVAVVHAAPHVAVPIDQSAAVTGLVALAVYLVPATGWLLLGRGRASVGLAVFTAGMAGSLALGVALHFVLPGPDNVAAVGGGWRVPFHGSAVALAVVDAAGTLVGILGLASRRRPDAGHATSGRLDGVAASWSRPLTSMVYWLAGRALGEVPEPLTVTAHDTPLLVANTVFEGALAGSSGVDDRLASLANVRAAMVVGCAFCIDIGSMIAVEEGVTEEELAALRDVEASDRFTERERLAVRYAEAISGTPVAVSDELAAALDDAFTDEELVALTGAIAYENYRARFNHALGIEAQGFADDVACPIPDPAGAASSGGSGG